MAIKSEQLLIIYLHFNLDIANDAEGYCQRKVCPGIEPLTIPAQRHRYATELNQWSRFSSYKLLSSHVSLKLLWKQVPTSKYIKGRIMLGMCGKYLFMAKSTLNEIRQS